MAKRVWKKWLACMLAMSMVVSLGACSGENGGGQEAPPLTQEVGEPDKSVYMDPTQDAEMRVEALLSQMTLEEKIGQMLQPEQLYITVEEVTAYGVGSVLSGGGAAPASGNTVTDWANHINNLKQAASETRLGIPLLYGVDAVHGNNNVYANTVFPHNVGLGATGDLELVEKIGEITAKEVRAIGVQWTFAPCLGNPQNVRWGRSYECFSEDTDEVAEFGAAYIRGFQGELGFTGLVVGDYNAVQQLSGHTYKEQIRQAIEAGVDLFMEVSTWKDVFKNVKKLVEDGDVSMELIDDAVRRILRVKFEAGLFEEEINSANEQALQAEVGSEAHREVAREAVRKSLVLLKNEDVGGQTALEALEAAANIRLCGQKAYDIGAQCGGWTITWQGLSGMITKGTSIIDGIAKAVMPEKKLSHDVKGEVASENEAIIVVVGEGPYAETEGDRKTNAVTISVDDKVMLGKLRDSLEAFPKDIPVVAILIGGRSLDISEYEDMFDGIIMAWLPGTEGAGIADVLFGEYDFTGKLNFTWYEVAGDPTSPVLYEKGYGLTK